MVNIALTAAEAKETILENACVSPDPSEAPKYPYGTTLDLNEEVLKKLNLTDLPRAGEEVYLTCTAKVSGTRENDEQGGIERCLTLQITDLDVKIPSQSAANRLYANDQSRT